MKATNLFLRVTVCCLLSGGLLMGCRSSTSAEPQIAFDWQLKPTPPKVGPVNCTLILRDAQKKPIEGAKVQLEGNMSHPGMQPVLSQMKETEPGKYTAAFRFTMGGDWFVLIDATLPGGRSWHHQVDVPNVASR